MMMTGWLSTAHRDSVDLLLEVAVMQSVQQCSSFHLIMVGQCPL